MKQLKKTVWIMLLAMAMTLGMLPAMTQTAFAESKKVDYISRSWSGGETGSVTETTKSQSCKVLEGSNAGSYTLAGGWFVVSKNVTYKGHMTISSDTKIVLCDGKTMTVKNGIYIKDGCTLTIYGQEGDSGKLDVKINDSYPGIGGENKTKGGNLIIHGGKVSAKGATNAAGIGGGDGENSGMGDVTIYGGTVTATGSSSAAGIGKGQHNNSFGTVTIYGGEVTATGGDYGAGIGGGEDRGSIPTKIYGGTVTATGGKDGAGIGGGEGGSGSDAAICIYGGTVTASSSNYGAGIGGGENAGGGTVTIKGGSVTAKGGSQGAGIGGGKNGSGGTVTVDGGTVSATGGSKSAGIGGGENGNGGTVTINDGTVNATSGSKGMGIGGYDKATVIIKGGTVNAYGTMSGNDGGTGIGVKNSDAVLTFRMSGGNVTAEVAGGGSGGAAIGGAYSNNVKLDISISGGILTAKGSSGGAAIGSGCAESTYLYTSGGDIKDGSTITISGGKVTATNERSGAGIGSGYGGNNKGTITISGGEVTATSSQGGAGIGGGCQGGSWDIGGNGGTVIINGGTVTAEASGSGNAQAIGHGDDDDDPGSLTIADKMCVKYDSSIADKDERVSKCRDHAKRIVEECEHEGHTYTSTKETHTQYCSYCKSSFSAEAHTWADTSDPDEYRCTVCGYRGSLYTVSFDANGGSGTMDSVSVVPDKDYVLPSPGFTAPAGKAFEAWTVKVGDEDKGDLLPGETITVTADTTATAKWSGQCVIFFEKGDDDASGSMDPQLIDVGGWYTFPKCGFTAPAGKAFKLWRVETMQPDGTTSTCDVPAGTTKSVDGHTIATAQWGDAYTVTLKPGEGSGEQVTRNVLRDVKYTLPTYQDCGFTPPEGQTFKEWSVVIGSAGAVSRQPKDKIIVTDNTTVTAVWQKHEHSFTYSADGKTITATCSNRDGACTLADNSVSLTIVRPTLDTYGGSGSAEATLKGLSDFNEATGKNIKETDIRYAGRDGTSYAESSEAPAGAGKYTAKITVEGATASVDYTIDQAETTVADAPAASEITYGQTLGDSTLSGGKASSGSTEITGSFAWEEPYTVPSVSDSESTEYTVIFTPSDPNYRTAETAATLKVKPAEAAYTTEPKAVEAELREDGEDHELITEGTTDDGTIYYAAGYAKTPALLAELQAPDKDSGDWSEAVPTGKDAGYYVVWSYISGDSNHNDSETLWLLKTIRAGDEQPDITDLPVINTGLEYSGQPQKLMTDPKDIPEGMDFMYYCTTDSSKTEPGEFSTDEPEGTAAGTYYVWFRADGVDEIAFPVIGPIPVSIGKTDLTVTADDSSITYGDEAPGYSATYSGFVSGEDASVLGGTLSFGCDYTQYSDAGEYSITPGGLTSDNYEITYETGTLTVGKRTVGLYWGETSFTYNGKAQAPEATATGTVNSDKIGVEVSVDGDHTDAGSYTATATALSGEKKDNYSLPSSGLSTQFTIGKAAARTLSDVRVDQPCSSEDISASVAGLMPKDAGELTYTAGTATKTGSVTVDSFSADESGNVKAKFSNGSKGDTITLPVNIGSTNYEDSTAKVVVTLTAGNYDVTVISGSGAGTYTEGDTVTITADDPAENQQFREWTTEDGVGFADAAASTTTFIMPGRNVTVTATYENKTAAYTKEPKAREITFDSEAHELVEPGETDEGTIMYAMRYADSLEGIKDLDEPATDEYSKDIPSGGRAGYYVIWYYIHGREGEYKDSARACLISVIKLQDPDKTHLPGVRTGLEYDGTKQALMDPPEAGDPPSGSFVYFCQKDSDVLPADAEFKAEIPEQKDAGMYYVWYSIEGERYGTGFPKMGPFSVSIDTVPLTITASDNTITYGEAPSNRGVTYEGLVSADKTGAGTPRDGALDGELKYYYSYVQYGDAGDYIIVATGLTSGNYEITYVDGKLTVVPKEVGLKWSNTAFRYNGSPQAPTAEATKLENGDEIGVGVTVEGEHTNAGIYTATAAALTGSKSGSYRLPEDRTTGFTIEKADARALDDVTVEQPCTSKEVSASVAGLMPTDAGTLTYTAGTAYGPKNVVVTGFSVDGDGNVTAMISGGRKGDVITLPVTISSDNYADSAVDVKVHIYAPEHTITFDLNGGSLNGSTGTVTVRAEYDSVMILPEPVREGYIFDYWEGSRYEAGADYRVTGDHSFRAIWKTADSGDDSDSDGDGGKSDNDKSGNGSSKDTAEKGVRTGDGHSAAAWIAVMIAAVLELAVLAIKRKGIPRR